MAIEEIKINLHDLLRLTHKNISHSQHIIEAPGFRKVVAPLISTYGACVGILGGLPATLHLRRVQAPLAAVGTEGRNVRIKQNKTNAGMGYNAAAKPHYRPILLYLYGYGCVE